MSNDLNTFLEEVNRLINTPKHQVLEYRIHYSDVTGSILSCTMCDHPLDTAYIVVNKEVYDNYFRYKKVQDGKLIPLDFSCNYRVQLVKNIPYLPGEFRVVKDHAALLLEDSEEYHDIDLYDRRPG